MFFDCEETCIIKIMSPPPPAYPHAAVTVEESLYASSSPSTTSSLLCSDSALLNRVATDTHDPTQYFTRFEVTIDPYQSSLPRGTVPPTTAALSEPSLSSESLEATLRRPQLPSQTSPSLVPAIRTRRELEEDDSSDLLIHSASSSTPLSYLHPSARARQSTPPSRESDSDWSRARKRPRVSVDSLSSVTSVERSLIPDEPSSLSTMRLPENDSESTLSVALADLPAAGPSSTNNLSNGHNGLVKGNGHSTFTNGNGKTGGVDGLKAEKQRMSVSRVSLPGTTLYDDSYVDREEFIRLTIQSLRDVGYIESAATLEAESGYTMETSDVSRFRECILNGDWEAAEEVLSRLGFSEQERLWDAKFLISQQKYLELLEAGRTTSALWILREELAPLSTNSDVLHSLSSLLMCRDADDLRLASGWDGAEGTSRRKLLVNLQRHIPSSIMIPQRRFASLLDQARDHQRLQCLYHNIPLDPHNFTLYADHACGKEYFPRITTAILEVHTDEVWNLQWSHSGSYLATASKDKSAVIWRIDLDAHPQTREYRPAHILRDHPYPVGYVAWSLDDSVLLTSSENYIKMWNTRTGSCIRTLDSHQDVVSAMVWLPDGSGFISGGLDRKIILWDADGKQRDSWGRTPIRVTDLAITPDFTKLVAVGMYDVPTPPPPPPSATVDGTNNAGNAAAATSPPKEFRLAVWDLSTKRLDSFERFEGELTSVKISDDSRYALLNRAPPRLAGEILLWEISTGMIVRKYTGHEHEKHVLRSCFGGVDENFIVTGSEDGDVYIWHRETATLLEMLEGHGAGSVNSAVWNPRNERMFATCSDDHTVRIWEAPIALSAPSTDLGEFAHDHDGAGKGKGKSRETWSVDSIPGVPSYDGLAGTSRSL